MTSLSADKFFSILEKSRLLTSEQLGQVQRAMENSSNPTPVRIARFLVKRKLCTVWQAERLLEGNSAFYLANYRFVEHIGRGAMGSVFKAEHAVMGRVVALKVLTKARLAHPNALARFQREVEAMAALDHPNIVTAYDAGQAGNTHYLVMEFIDGVDLNAWIEGYGKLKIPWACEIIRQSALGLDHAHQQGMIHRDIKPANILVAWKDDRPVAKILDLGLARIFTEDDLDDTEFDVDSGDDTGFGISDTVEAQLTHAGTILGTPDYLAPEQILSNHTVDGRADIFSLGCTLFKLLTGDLPYSGPDLMGKLEARVNPAAPPPLRLRTLLPEAQPGLEEVIDKMVRRDPDERFQSAWEVADALSPYADNSPGRWHDYVPLHQPERDSSEVGSSQMATKPRLQNFLSQLATDSPPEAQFVDTQSNSGQATAVGTAAGTPNTVTIVPVKKTARRAPFIRFSVLLILVLALAGLSVQQYLFSLSSNSGQDAQSGNGHSSGGVPLGLLQPGPGGWPGKAPGLVFAAGPETILSPHFKLVGDAEAHPQGLWSLAGGHVDVSPQLDQAIDQAMRNTGQMTLAATLQPADRSQDGPAQIITFGNDPQNPNFTLEQEKSTLVLRLRTSHGGQTELHVLPLVDLRKAPRVHLVVTYFPGLVTCYRNGVAESKHDVPGNFSGWAPEPRLALGDDYEPQGAEHTWRGTLGFVALYNRAMQPWEVQEYHQTLERAMRDVVPRRPRPEP